MQITEDAIGNLFPVLYRVELEASGKRFEVAELNMMEIARPVSSELKQKNRRLPAKAGSTVFNTTLLRNVSPFPLNMNVDAVLPHGWKLDSEKMKIKFRLEPYQSFEFPIAVKIPADTTVREGNVRIQFNYTDNQKTLIFNNFKIILNK